MKKILALISSATALLFVGCETTHVFSVNSYNHPAPVGVYRTFAIGAGPEIELPESLQFMEATGFAKTALISEGFREAGNPEEADLLVEISYEISDPQTSLKERSEPVYARIRGGYSKRLVKVRGTDGKIYSRVVYCYHPSRSHLIGWDTDITSETLYEKTLTMRAYATNPDAEAGEVKEIWMVQVSNRNKSEDLRYYIPRMVAAGLDYIDYNSESLQRVKLPESDPRIQLILALDI